MEHLTKLLRDSYDLQENKPEKSAYWHLQKLRSEIKQLTISRVVSTCCNNPKEKHGSTAMYEHYKYCGNCGKDLL
jgi:hypothetical protein